MHVHVWEGFLISFDSWDILRSLLTQVTQVWPGMAWYGLVWPGMAWYGLVLLQWEDRSHVAAMAQDVWRLAWLSWLATFGHGVVRKRLVPGVPRCQQIWRPLWIRRPATRQLQFLGEKCRTSLALMEFLAMLIWCFVTKQCQCQVDPWNMCRSSMEQPSGNTNYKRFQMLITLPWHTPKIAALL